MVSGCGNRGAVVTPETTATNNASQNMHQIRYSLAARLPATIYHCWDHPTLAPPRSQSFLQPVVQYFIVT